MKLSWYHRELHDLLKQQRMKGLGWRFDGVDDWSTDAIFAQLSSMGIDTDVAGVASDVEVQDARLDGNRPGGRPVRRWIGHGFQVTAAVRRPR